MGRDELGDGLGHVNSKEGTTIAVAEIPLAISDADPSMGYSDLQQDPVMDTTPVTASLHGVVFMEIVSAANLPEMPNALRTGFDMDPFVVISYGKYIFRTRVIRHNPNPVWKAKLMFRVHHGEESFEIKFSIHDWDKMSGNDNVGTVIMPINDLIQAASAQEDVLALPPSPLTPNGVQNFDPDMRDYIRSIVIDDSVKVPADNAQLRFLAKFVPYTALRRRFWYGLAKANGIDNYEGLYRKVLIQNMLEGLGSTLCNESIDDLFKHYNKDPEQDGLTFDELYESLEQRIKLGDGTAPKSPKSPGTKLFGRMFKRSKDVQEDQDLPDTASTHEGEHIIRISTCPICHNPCLGQKSETDVITHIALCSGSDGFDLDKLIMNDYGTEANAQRKWITKFIKGLGYGRYIVGEVKERCLYLSLSLVLLLFLCSVSSF